MTLSSCSDSLHLPPTLLRPLWSPGRLPDDCLSGSLGPWLPAGSGQQGPIAGDWRAGEETGLSISPQLPSSKAATASMRWPLVQREVLETTPAAPQASGSQQLPTAAEDCSTPVWFPLTSHLVNSPFGHASSIGPSERPLFPGP